MAGAVKHMQRSHKTYGKNIDFRAFERKATVVRNQKEQKSLFEKIFGKFHKHQSK